MNLPTTQQMTWFVQRLIDIRNDIERTPNHIADIEFDYKEIIGQKKVFGIKTKILAQTKIDEMLYLIKGDNIFLDSLNHFDKNNLLWERLPSGSVLIKGYQMEVLEGYMLRKIKGISQKSVDSGVDLDSLRIIFRKDDEFYINETDEKRHLKLRKTALYYKAFTSVYELRPDGGTISYKDFAGTASSEIKIRLKGKDGDGKCAVVKSYLTDKSNGFLRASKIGEAKFKGRPLIECDPVNGIVFNNKR